MRVRTARWWILSLLFAAVRSYALEIVPASCESLCVSARITWQEALPTMVAERLERGIPASLAIQVGLWRERGGWFDSEVQAWEHRMQLQRDPLTERFRIRDEHGSYELRSLQELEARVRAQELEFPVQIEWCDGRSRYRLVAIAAVQPLTSRDVGELESWMGEAGGRGSPGLLGLPANLFGLVRDLSGLGERRTRAESEPFLLRLDVERGTATVEAVETRPDAR